MGASPNAANLAAKVLAVAPSLTPPEVIAVIEENADKRMAGDSSFLLINPRKTIERLR